MPRKDIFHESVVNALEKDGWKVTNDPLRIVAGGVGLFIDIAAEPIISIEKTMKKLQLKSNLLKYNQQLLLSMKP